MLQMSDDRNLITDDTDNDVPLAGGALRLTSTPNRLAKTKKRKQPSKSSIIWNHVKSDIVDLILTLCNHCKKTWTNLKVSTSNPMFKLKKHHWDRLTAQVKEQILKNGETSSSGVIKIDTGSGRLLY